MADHLVVFFLWHSKLSNVINVYKQFSTRCCAVRVQLQQLSVALVCVYFPTDNQSVVPSQELVDVIDSLETFIYTLDVDCVILGGGGACMNTHFSRINGQFNCVQDFCKRVNMVLCKNFFSHEFLYTRFCNNSNSFIDRFVISCDFANMNLCNNLRVFDDNALGEVNLSDHCVTAYYLKATCFL